MKKKKIAAIKEEGEFEEEGELLLWEQEAKVSSKVDKEKVEKEKAKARQSARGDVSVLDQSIDSEIESETVTQKGKKKPPRERVSGSDSVSTGGRLTSKREIAAGELKSSSGLEQGTKQRKTNRQFQSSEAADVESIDTKKEKEL